MFDLPESIPSDFGAAIARMNDLDVLGADDLIMMALIESTGEASYSAMADAAPDEISVALLKRNGQEETGHAYRLVKAVKILTGKEFSLPDLADNPYYSPMSHDQLSEDILTMIRDMEYEGERQYLAWAERESNPDVKKILRLIAPEEKRHGDRIQEVIDILIEKPVASN